jgi:hypothetical protein
LSAIDINGIEAARARQCPICAIHRQRLEIREGAVLAAGTDQHHGITAAASIDVAIDCGACAEDDDIISGS